MQNLTKPNKACWLLRTQFIYKLKFKEIGAHSKIVSPLRFEDTGSVIIQDYVFISNGAWIIGDKEKDCTLVISSGTVIGNFFHIVAKYDVAIEKNVLIADKVFISDCTHNYKDISMPVIEQPLSEVREVIVGEGSWIGENVSIIGAKIGKHCVIGANSVVTKDIPDYCVAVGNPAIVIKQYNFLNKKWERV